MNFSFRRLMNLCGGTFAIIRRLLPLVVLAIPLVLPLSAWATVNFNHTSGFGAATTLTGEANRQFQGVSDPPVRIGPIDTGGDGQLSVLKSEDAATEGAKVAVAARADAELGTLGAFIRTSWSESNQTGNQFRADAQGFVESKFYATCTIGSDSLAPGTPVSVALFWKLKGTFSRQTLGVNAGNVTLFIQALDGTFPHPQLKTHPVVVVSSTAGKVNLSEKLDLPSLAIGDSVIVEPILHLISASLAPASVFGESGIFISDFEASVIPVVTSPNVDAQWKCAGLTKSRLESAQWEVMHCPGPEATPVPKRELQVVFIPVRYKDGSSHLTFDEVTKRIVYLKDYFFQQSMCSVDINPIIIRDLDTDGWLNLGLTQKDADDIPGDPANNFRRAATIWLHAFEKAVEEEPAFLVNQQAGLDAIVVITTDPNIRSRATITKSIADRKEALDALLNLILRLIPVQEVQAVKDLIAGPLKLTLFKQGSVLMTDIEPTGVWIHELGHALFTFWDYYATFEPFVRGDILGRENTLQDWGLMGGARNIPPPPVITYNKQIAGWLQYQDIPADGFGDYPLVSLKDMEFGSKALRYKSPKGPIDWYIFELRTPPDDIPTAPEQTPITGKWEGVTYDGTNTILTDNTPNANLFGTANSQKGKFIRPNANQPHHFEIVANTGLTVSIEGDQRGIVAVGNTYEIDVPRHSGIAGIWEGVVFDGTNTILTDNSPNVNLFGMANSQRDKFIRPNANQRPHYFKIVANTGSTVSIEGDQRGIVAVGDLYQTAANTTPSNAQTGVVIYGKREINLSVGRTPACGSLHGFDQQSLNVLFAHEFGSCLEKIHNVNLFPVDSQEYFTLIPGTSFTDDLANVEFALSNDLVLSIKGSAKSRIVVSLESSANITGTGSLKSVIFGSDLTLPIDLHILTDDGRHIGPNYHTNEYEVQIDNGRVGGAYTPAQWISLPDDVEASYFIDASKAVANAKALGLQSLDIEATVSVIHYDANGVVSELQAPVVVRLNLDQPTTSPIKIPLGAPSVVHVVSNPSMLFFIGLVLAGTLVIVWLIWNRRPPVP